MCVGMAVQRPCTVMPVVQVFTSHSVSRSIVVDDFPRILDTYMNPLIRNISWERGHSSRAGATEWTPTPVLLS